MTKTFANMTPADLMKALAAAQARIKELEDDVLAIRSRMRCVEKINETLGDWVDEAKGQISTLTADLAAARGKAIEECRPFAEFVHELLTEGSWSGHDLDGGFVQDVAEKLGLIVKTKFDPEKHDNETGADLEPGDDWFEFSPLVNRALASAPVSTGVEPNGSQGRCETTLTERFANPDCKCPTYAGNLGPCRTFEVGMSERCVYCDHERDCHPIPLCRCNNGFGPHDPGCPAAQGDDRS